MSDLAVIRATFCDWRTVKGRKQLQIILEVPLEQQQDVLTRLGAPDPSNPRWVAVALLAAPEPPKAVANANKIERAKQTYRDMPAWKQAAARSGMLRRDVKFQLWASKRQNGMPDIDSWLRATLGVNSCAEIGTDERAYNAFIQLETQYQMETGQLPEVRG